jgi:peptidoglycan/xylan/chitin deacetylase (PgdA/CDA1 family)
VVEGARLESVYRGNSIGGSNPPVSAMFYLVRTPGWLSKFYKAAVWQIDGPGKTIYLTFDDGPHPDLTPFILDELKRYHAKASFFCLGRNVQQYPGIYERILDEGHATGNHSFDHPDGWKTSTANYLANIASAQEFINSKLFRPPYGRTRHSQRKALAAPPYALTTIMWTVISGDFDTTISPEKCFSNVRENAGNGSIVLFHDNSKAETHIRYALPRVLEYFAAQGYSFEKIIV